MKAVSLWTTRAIFAAALIAFSTLPTSAFADRDDDAKSARKDHRSEGLVLTNARIYTMDGSNRVVDEVLVKDGRFVEVGKKVDRAGRVPVIDARGRTVIPGIIDAHVHVVLVGNRPGWHTPMEHVFTIPDAITAYQARVADVSPGDFITTIGPISAMQFAEQRLPTLAELDVVGRPVYIQAAQGGTRANSAARAWFMANAPGVNVADSGAVTGPALQALRSQLLTPETRKRTAFGALQYFASLGITTHRDAGAFHSELPSNGIANENTYTMHFPFLALQRERNMPARLRIDFLHQDSANDPTLPTLAPRLRNSFPFFGDDWLRTGGIGEFTRGGGEPVQGDGRRPAGRLGPDAHRYQHRAGVPYALRQRHPARLSLRRRRHHRHQPMAQFLHHDHRQEPARRSRQRRAADHALGDVVARHGGEQVVHLGGRRRLDRGRQPRRLRGARQRLFQCCRRRDTAHPVGAHR